MVQAAQQAAIVEWLQRPESYPHRPARIEYVESHISHVFLAGELVYKLKKPVVFDFLDFSTIAAREHACREEVRLNRRLAPEAYLGVVPITRENGSQLRLGGDGEVVDWLVEMRRLPTDLTLDALHCRGELTPGHVERLAHRLAHFYASLPALPISAGSYRDRYLAHVANNRRELVSSRSALARDVVARVSGFQMQLLALAPELCDERVRRWKIVEGHGDLRPEHICLATPIAIFDCIEFNRDFRTIDVADELAFLAAECDFLGADWVGPQLLEDYERWSGDSLRPVLWSFYKAYRACVRAKVADLLAEQLSDQSSTPAQSAADDARRHLALADQYCRLWIDPLVIVVGGLSGTGKTTLASALAELLGAELLRTDVVRRELGASGDYRPEARQKVYDELLRRAARRRAEGLSVVLDGTFGVAENVRQAFAVAGGSKGAFVAIECVCPPETAQSRIAARLAGKTDASDATPDVHQRQRREQQTWPNDIPQVRIDTEQPLETQIEQAVAALRGVHGGRSAYSIDFTSRFDD